MWLFRAGSVESQGINKLTLVVPGAALKCSPVTDYEPIIAREDMPRVLTAALNWSRTCGNEITFWTSSLLFAIQTAMFRQQKEQDDVYILCINTHTAQAMDGGPVQFHYVPDLKAEYGVDLRNKDGTLQDHSEIYISMECFNPGADARKANFVDMKTRGLFDLFPALQGSERSHRPRLNFVVQDMRDFHFQSTRSINEGQLRVAANVASSFAPAPGTTSQKVFLHVFICLLAMRKRIDHDHVLLRWLPNNTVAAPSIPEHYSIRAEEHSIPEIEQALKLSVHFAGRKVLDSALVSRESITESERRRDWQAFRTWRRNKRDARGAARDENSDRASSPDSAEVQKHRRSSRGDNGGREDRYRNGKKRDRVPREQYELRLVQKISANSGRFSRNAKRGRDEEEGFEIQGIGVQSRSKRPRRDLSGRRPRRDGRY